MGKEILEILMNNKSEVDNFNDAVFETDFIKVTKELDALFAKRIVSKLLNEKEEINFEEWRLQHKFEITEHGYYKNGITYMVDDITFMYISDVFNI